MKQTSQGQKRLYNLAEQAEIRSSSQPNITHVACSLK